MTSTLAVTLRRWAAPGESSPAAVDADIAVLQSVSADPVMRRFLSWRVDSHAEGLAHLADRAQEWAVGTRCSWAVLKAGPHAAGPHAAGPNVAEPGGNDGSWASGVLGEVGLKLIDQHARFARLAVWTHPDHRGRGVATSAVRAAVDYGITTLGLRTFGYTHAAANTASGLVAQRAGFVCVGPELPDAPPDHPRADRLLWQLRHEPGGRT